MPNDRSTPEKVFSYGIGIFGNQIECYRIGDEFFLYGVTEHGDDFVLSVERGEVEKGEVDTDVAGPRA